MSNTLGAIVCVAVMLLMVIAALWVTSSASNETLRRWAEPIGFEILRFHQTFIFTGPYRWSEIREGRAVYFVRVRNREGLERSCWILTDSESYSRTEVIEVRWQQ